MYRQYILLNLSVMFCSETEEKFKVKISVSSMKHRQLEELKGGRTLNLYIQ